MGVEKAAYGQALFETVARFPRPTAAVISGPCVGGGYELALACTYRVAENVPQVRVGLPEVKLGILPGFGGTQRLPHRVGLRGALDMILSGKTLPAKPAFRRGLVDALVPEGEGRRVTGDILLGRRSVMPAQPGRLDRVLASVPFLRNYVLGKARGALRRKVRENHYPAPFRALECVGHAFSRGEVAAYRAEAEALGETIVTETSKNLAWLFTTQGEMKSPRGLDLSLARSPQRFAVLGAGVMGGGIGWLAAEKGRKVRIKDVAPAALASALATAGGLWAGAVRRRRLTPHDRAARVERLSFTLDYTGFAFVDFVFEAVVENLEVKRKVVEELEAHVGDEVVIASNTSSLPIGDIARGARVPGRVVGLHFFNPVDRMPLVEVIAGPASDPAAVATAFRTALDLGKTPILVQDGPGFLVNRLLAFYLGEALSLYEAGADIRRVDATFEDFGMPVGPFELLDQIGLDVAEKVTHVLGAAFGERLPAQSILSTWVKEGHLGKKTGRGFYRYEKGKKRGPAISQAGDHRLVMSEEDLLDRLILPMINEAARCLDEGVVQRPLDVDVGMVFGTGFPPFRGGLLRYADARGVATLTERLDALVATVGERMRPSEALRQRAGGFYA